RPVIDRVYRRDDGEKNLRRANVARRFLAADVLFARLQRKPIRGSAFCVVRNSDEAAGHVAFVLIARGKIGGMWSTESERNTKPLRVPDGNVSAKFAGRLKRSEERRVGKESSGRCARWPRRSQRCA